MTSLREAVAWGRGEPQSDGLGVADRLWVESQLALWSGDFDDATRKIDEAVRLSADPGILAARVWVRIAARGRPTTDELAELRAIVEEAPDSLEASVVLVRALLRASQVESASKYLQLLGAVSPDSPSAALAEAEVHAARGDSRSALAALRRVHRFTDRVPAPVLSYEMVQATNAHDSNAFRDAYAARAALLDHPMISWVPQVWMNLSRVLAILVGLWALGVVIDVPAIWIAALIGETAFSAVHWHVLRNLRLLFFFSTIILLQSGLVAVAELVR